MALKVKIKYNGETTELESGKKAVLACSGKNMLSDIEIIFEADSGDDSGIVTITVIDESCENDPDTFVFTAVKGQTFGEFIESANNSALGSYDGKSGSFNNGMEAETDVYEVEFNCGSYSHATTYLTSDTIDSDITLSVN